MFSSIKYALTSIFQHRTYVPHHRSMSLSTGHRDLCQTKKKWDRTLDEKINHLIEFILCSLEHLDSSDDNTAHRTSSQLQLQLLLQLHCYFTATSPLWFISILFLHLLHFALPYPFFSSSLFFFFFYSFSFFLRPFSFSSSSASFFFLSTSFFLFFSFLSLLFFSYTQSP